MSRQAPRTPVLKPGQDLTGAREKMTLSVPRDLYRRINKLAHDHDVNMVRLLTRLLDSAPASPLPGCDCESCASTRQYQAEIEANYVGRLG